MISEQIIDIMSNGVGGYDLVVEKNSGIPVRILSGNRSLKFWKRLRDLCNDVIFEIESKPKIKKKRKRINGN